MDDIKRAHLGDKEAANRQTEAGVLLPCPMCKEDARLNTWRFEAQRKNPAVVKCSKCGLETRVYDRIKDARLAWNSRATVLNAEEMETLENWTGKYRRKAELYPLLVTQAEENALEQIPKQTRKEAAEAIQKERDERFAAGKRQKALENLQTQRRNLLEELLGNFPLYQAERYFRAMTQAEYTGEKIPLYSDQEAIQYAFMTCEERERVFAPALFGSEKKAGEGFVYDETILALTKHLQRYRGAIKDRNDNAPDPNREAGKKDKIEDLLEEKRDQGVDLWLMGLALLKHRQVTEREFVQKFARYLSAAQEEKNQEGGAAHAEPLA